MSELPQGQFWCWLHEHTGAGARASVELNTACEPDGSGADYGTCIMWVDDFQHIFGTAPAPGEALLLDDNVRVRTCHDCKRELGGELDAPQDDCPGCGSSNVDHHYHARIVQRLPLGEEKT